VGVVPVEAWPLAGLIYAGLVAVSRTPWTAALLGFGRRTRGHGTATITEGA